MARILLADDSADYCRVIRRALESHGHSVAAVNSGAECLCELKNKPGAFDLLILDLAMPAVDGLTVIRCLPPQSPPVVVATADDAAVPKDVPPPGVRHVLLKPFHLPELLAAINDATGCPTGGAP